MISGLLQFAFVLVVILSSSACTNYTVHAFSSNITDQQALLEVKSSITRDPLNLLSSWNHSVHVCVWQGVTCNRRHGRVMELNLSSQQLEGTLSPYIGNLSFLTELNLETNNFHGSIPSEIGKLFRLQYLLLGQNSFEGTFPANMTHWYDIQVITMNNNHLSGNLPTEFTSWSTLTYINLLGNKFTGSIPPSIGNMSSLTVLDLGENNLVGSIPWEISKLSELTYLVLSVNNLSGMVPLPLYNMSLLSSINIAQNHLEGTIPSDLGFTLPSLMEFCFSFNNFSGPLPPSIANASNLVNFDIGDNSISGPLQVSFERVPKLEKLNLGDNPQLGFNISPGDLISSLVNCTQLYSLALYGNGFKGELPKSIGNLSTSLNQLELYSNYIHGSIPKEIVKLVGMATLDLCENSFTGVIPETIGELYNLGQLFLYTNNISGKIPASISNITRLSDLALHNNMLQGSIPPALFSVHTLQTLSLYRNRLSGAIPEQLVGLSSQCNNLHLQQNLFTGSLPSNIGNFKHLVSLDVSGNRLTGEIPFTLGDCEMLELLSVKGNHFEGSIPSSFKKLKSLKTLDLSSNLLSGKIPRFFGGFPLIQNLNLSHNNLEGEVPKEGVFFNISAFSVVGNMQLCGGIQVLQLPACQMNTSRSKKHKFPLRLIPLLVIPPLAILLASIALIIYRPKRAKMKSVPVSELLDERHPRVSHRELSLATDDYSRKNLVGEGRYASVYKGTLMSLKQIVAVKVINVEVRGANKSFLAECEMLRNIRHRNLIKIITVCSSTDHKGNPFKAMVLEFMRNGSLDNWLHLSLYEEEEERNLTLLQRLNISIDVASAVDYLHHHSHTRIIHCDIKPSNILLDKDLVACVGDFGLAKFFFASAGDIISQPHTNSTGVRGTIGYLPPEYGMGGEISAEGDVYSFGILLLELFSGKRPTDSLLNSNLHDYVKQGLPQRVMHIADQRITQENSNIVHDQSHRRATESSCLASVFQVGISCSVEAPKERMDISVALKQLTVARDSLLRAGTNTE